jgi:hypothetical protein
MPEDDNTAAESAPQPESTGQPESAPPESTEESTPTEPVATEEITYHAVEKDGQVTAIWEMQGRKHLRTIDPRSRQGQEILRLYTADHHDEAAAAPPQESGEAAAS